MLYERVGEAARSFDLAAVLREAFLEVEGDVAQLVQATRWVSTDPGAIVAMVDGRVIGWLALGDHAPQLLVSRLAGDLERLAASAL